MAEATSINWPNNLERTPPGERHLGTKFSATLANTTSDIADEMRKVGADDWQVSIGNNHTKKHGLPRHNANPDDPGFVIRWTRDGKDYAVACDYYVELYQNARAVFLWLKETRKRTERPVRTASDSYAAAALPSGEGAETKLDREPHEVLQLAPDASPEVVKAVGRKMKARAHPDSTDDCPHTVKEVQQAVNSMLDDS
jgi:hypothetical protein